ncbi:MAG: tetratricopeptide repeat protein [Bacteroidales bacterium]|nr:tetratricopeptide repeat protein [Bacteroidales bacterium]
MRISLTLIVFYLFQFLPLTLEAQHNVDSLKSCLNDAGQNEKLEIYKRLAFEYQNISIEQSIEYDKKAIEILEVQNKQKEISDILNNIGLSYYSVSNYVKAIDYFIRSLKIKEEIGDKKSIAKSLNNIGVVYKIFGNYSKAIDYLKQSLVIKEEINDKLGFAQTLNNIGVIYKDLGDFRHSLEYTREALEIYEILNNKDGIASAYNNIGIAFEGLNNINFALDYFYKSLKIKEELNDKKGIGNTYNNIGNIFKKKNNYEKAIEYYLMSLSIRNEINDKFGIASSLNNIGEIYCMNGEYQKAINVLNRSLEISLSKNLLDIQKRNYKIFSKVYLKSEDYKMSLEFYKKFIKIKDSIYTGNINKQLSILKVKYDSEKKGKENILLKKDIEIQQVKIRLYQIILIVLLLAAGIIAFFIFRNYRNKKSAFEIIEKKDTKISDQELLIEDTLGKYQETKDQNHAILEVLPDLIFLFDKNGKFLFYHAPNEDILYVKPEKFMGKSIYDVLPKEITDKFNSAFKKISKSNNLTSFEYDLKISDEIKNFEVRIIKTGSGDFFSIIRDITDIKSANSEAEEANKTKSLVMASLSHEIRTPLSSIIGVTSLIEETELTEEQKEYLGVIITSGNNLLYLINNILDFSKLDAGKIKIEKYEFNLQKLVDEVIRMLEVKVVDDDIEIFAEVEKNIPQIVIGDKLRLNQVLINLINNALKFTKKGTVKVKVEKFDQNATSIRLKFSVIDTGEGVSFEERDKLFRDFSQANDAITRRYGGTGLGLSICKQLVTMMGGEIGLESAKGKGSNFWFTIVFNRSSEIESKTLKPPISIKQKIKKDKNALSVLLVEDNLLNQKFAVAILKKEGHEVDIADNGKIGVDFYTKNKYDIVLMDIQMPVMNGIEATKNIRKYERDNKLEKTRIIAVTAFAMEGDKDRFLSAGIDEYLAKPYKVTDLIALLKTK